MEATTTMQVHNAEMSDKPPERLSAILRSCMDLSDIVLKPIDDSASSVAPISAGVIVKGDLDGIAEGAESDEDVRVAESTAKVTSFEWGVHSRKNTPDLWDQMRELEEADRYGTALALRARREQEQQAKAIVHRYETAHALGQKGKKMLKNAFVNKPAVVDTTTSSSPPPSTAFSGRDDQPQIPFPANCTKEEHLLVYEENDVNQRAESPNDEAHTCSVSLTSHSLSWSAASHSHAFVSGLTRKKSAMIPLDAIIGANNRFIGVFTVHYFAPTAKGLRKHKWVSFRCSSSDKALEWIDAIQCAVRWHARVPPDATRRVLVLVRHQPTVWSFWQPVVEIANIQPHVVSVADDSELFECGASKISSNEFESVLILASNLLLAVSSFVQGLLSSQRENTESSIPIAFAPLQKRGGAFSPKSSPQHYANIIYALIKRQYQLQHVLLCSLKDQTPPRIAFERLKIVSGESQDGITCSETVERSQHPRTLNERLRQTLQSHHKQPLSLTKLRFLPVAAHESADEWKDDNESRYHCIKLKRVRYANTDCIQLKLKAPKPLAVLTSAKDHNEIDKETTTAKKKKKQTIDVQQVELESLKPLRLCMDQQLETTIPASARLIIRQQVIRRVMDETVPLA